jgi:hypothetical protein
MNSPQVVDPFAAHWGVTYKDLGNGAYCQVPSTFRVRHKHRRRVILGPQNSNPTDFDPWDV